MAVADIRDNLPPQLRRAADNDTEKICNWLRNRNFQGLIEVTGSPGQERAVLTLGKIPQSPMPSGSERSEPASAGALASASNTSTAFAGGSAAAAAANSNSGPDADDENPATVQLRGLPFRATIADIRSFLGDHCAGLSKEEPCIRLLLNRDGRPSGFARVHFATPQAAQAAREALHKKHMGDRFVEVLACTERGGKLRHRPAPNPEAPGVEDAEQEYKERERVLEECREHMRRQGPQSILLSMLGIALSAPARNYLRKTNLGLKHFLARVPNEFRVQGMKGCETVSWCGSGSLMEQNPFAAMGMMPWGVDMGEPGTPDQASSGMAMPTSGESGGPCVATPSVWGTPKDHPGAAAGTHQNIPPQDLAAMMNFNNPWFGNPWGGWWDPAWGADPTAMGLDMGGKGKDAAKLADSKAKRGARSEAAATRSHAHLHPQSHPYANRPAGGESAAPAAAAGTEGEMNLATTKLPTLRLRGLPFSVSVQDVLAFFAQHEVADRIADGPNVAELLPKANGRPSGQAVILMRSLQDAKEAKEALANKYIGGRYIEVFVYGEDEGGEGATDDNANGSTAGEAGGAQAPAAGGMSGADMLASMNAAAANPWIPWVGLPPPPSTSSAGPAEMPDWMHGMSMPWGSQPPPAWAMQPQLGGNLGSSALSGRSAEGDIAAARGLPPGGTHSAAEQLAQDAPTRPQTLQV